MKTQRAIERGGAAEADNKGRDGTNASWLIRNLCSSNLRLTAEEQSEKAALYASTGDTRYRDELVMSVSRWIVEIAIRRAVRLNAWNFFPDFVQAGFIGAMHAVKKFNRKKGTSFSTYSSWWINQEINVLLRNQLCVIKLPAYLQLNLGRVKRAMLESKRRHGRGTSLSEIVGRLKEQLKITKKHARLLETFAGFSISSSDSVLASLREDNFETLLISEELKQKAFDCVVSHFSWEDAEVMLLYFGLADDPPLGFKDISARTPLFAGGRLTREKARQIVRRGLSNPSFRRCVRNILKGSGLPADDRTGVNMKELKERKVV